MKEDDYKKKVDKISHASTLDDSTIQAISESMPNISPDFYEYIGQTSKAVYESTKNLPTFGESTLIAGKVLNEIVPKIESSYVASLSQIGQTLYKSMPRIPPAVFESISQSSKPLLDSIVTLYNTKGYFSALQKAQESAPLCFYPNAYSTLPVKLKNSNDTSNEQSSKVINVRDLQFVESLATDIKENEIKSFLDFLYDYPLLAFKDEKGIGNKIYEELEKKIEKLIIPVEKDELFRIRTWSDNQSENFDKRQMFEPIYGIDKTGRFSCFGQNPLYMSTQLVTCLAEIKKEKIKCTGIRASLKHKARVLDFSSDDIIFEYCHIPLQEGRVNEYILPNFISECCQLISRNKNIQLDGIKYKSTILEGGINYAFFSFGYGNFLDDMKIIPNDEIEKKMANIKA